MAAKAHKHPFAWKNNEDVIWIPMEPHVHKGEKPTEMKTRSVQP